MLRAAFELYGAGDRDPVVDALVERVAWQINSDYAYDSSVTHWNDDFRREHEDVIGLLRRVHAGLLAA
jgi:hypothetical protein